MKITVPNIVSTNSIGQATGYRHSSPPRALAGTHWLNHFFGSANAGGGWVEGWGWLENQVLRPMGSSSCLGGGLLTG